MLVAAEAAAAAAGLWRRADHARAADNAGRRARQLAEACEGARPPGIDQAGDGATLTARERQVAELAAGGRTSKAIAEELVVSIRTVDNLLARTYAKLGITGRAELADALDLR
jgi:DNA-binding NarL/FixJ family response regulator